MRAAPILLLTAWLAGCAAVAPAPDPREEALAAPPEAALGAALDLLSERGYVIRHADGDLGRAEAVLARWPGYRVRVEVTPAEGGSRVALSATWGGRALPADRLDPLLADLESRLGTVP
ncbi:hypothetical protein [Halomonas sp. NO4]|uniref:hypothetical protein n=1 Tax=Halomonas sp. NO4 TaxID=2484813 RepID=UPI0013D66B3D|nr:hypothetical protein [Halomonas sp. NO4]